jgi:hypothetical protein
MYSDFLGLLWSVAIGQCGESAFYRSFLSQATTNDLQHLGIAMTSPTLTDTNNTSPKLAGVTNSLTAMKERGEVGGIRIGMSMSDVVSEWGKPSRFFARCMGGPRLDYSDATLIFHGDVLWEVLLSRTPGVVHSSSRAVRFEQGLSLDSSLQDCVRVLGEPTRRSRWNDAVDYLVYESAQQALIFAFVADSGSMLHVVLQKRGDGPFWIH